MSGWQRAGHDPRRQQQPQQAWPPRQQQAPGQWPPQQQPPMRHLVQAPPGPHGPAAHRVAPPPPAVPRPGKAARGRGPYPSHLTRFPRALIPGARRRRGPSIWRLVWLGTHPVAALISLMISLCLLCLILGWIALVGLGWLLWCSAVTVAWACGGFQDTPQRGLPTSPRR